MATLSSRQIAAMVELTEAEAYADLLRAAPAGWHCIAELTPAGWFLCAPALDVLLFNRLIGCGIETPARRQDVAALIKRYRGAALRNFGVQVSPSADPGALVGWLHQDGLLRQDNWTKVYRAAGDEPAVHRGLTIERIDGRKAAVFAHITCVAFGMSDHLEPWISSTVERPGWHHYIAWHGADPVAAAALFVRGEVGWLGIAGTMPTARRRGAQSALIAQRLLDGRELGCRWFVTETTEDLHNRPNPSFHNMMRAGFSVAYQRANYLPSASI